MRFHIDSTACRIRLSTDVPHWLFILLSLFVGCGFLPSVDVTAEGETTTTESGGSVGLLVTLTERPKSPIEIYAVSSNEREGAVSGVLRFDSSNWRESETLRVTGVDDDTSDGDVTYWVSVYARKTREPGAHPWLVAKFSFVNRDDDLVTFEPIGDLPGGETSSTALAVSEDGSVVVGFSGAEDGDQAVRFTREGLLALGGPNSRAEAVSPGGTRIVGSVADARFEKGRAAASFTPGEGFMLLAGPPQPGVDQGPLMYFVDATVVADDGLVWGTCIQYAAYGEPLGCRKAPEGTLELMFRSSYIHAADAMHNFSGEALNGRHAPPGSRAVYNGSPLPFPAQLLCDPGCVASAQDFSTGGARIVGTALLPTTPPPSSSWHQTAFLYTTSEGMVALPDLDGGERTSAAYAVSTDGRIVGGYGSDERGQQALLWIDGVARALEDIVLEADGSLPEGWVLREVRAMSGDGRVLVGNGINPAGDSEGFRLTLPQPL